MPAILPPNPSSQTWLLVDAERIDSFGLVACPADIDMGDDVDDKPCGTCGGTGVVPGDRRAIELAERP